MRSTPHYLEIEVKFHLLKVERMHKRLLELGAAAGPESFETNLRFENPAGTLKNSDRLLRLRKDGACRLTFKERPANQTGECKTYHELEVEVSDFDTMTAILNALGFTPVQRYDKLRRIFTWQDVEICIDTMPFGTFMEIEGPEESIKATAELLELPWEHRILANYLSIFELLRKNHHWSFNDVTFENFASFSVDITHYLPDLWAEPAVH